MSAANASAQQPFSNLGWLSSLALPLGALGSQSSMTGSTTQQTSPISNILGGLFGGLGLIGGTGGFGANGWLNGLNLGGLFGVPGSSMWTPSDARLKEDIKPIGMLYDDTPIYSYNYKDDPARRPQIGLLAQDIEQRRPDAVVEFGPRHMKAVHYSKATERACYLGMLSDLDLAA